MNKSQPSNQVISFMQIQTGLKFVTFYV